MSAIRIRLVPAALLSILVMLTLVPAAIADPCWHYELGEVGSVIWWSGDQFFSLPYYHPYWILVAVRQDSNSVCDADVRAYRNWDGGTYPDCASDLLASSQAEGGLVDFVVGDFNHNPSDTTYFHVFCYGGSNGYVINHDADNGQLVIDGSSVHEDVGAWDFARMWDVYLTAGVEYAFDLDATSPYIRMALFASSGAEYWSSRGDGVWDTARDTVWMAPSSDWYGVVVYADLGVEASYDIRVGYPCVNVELADGVPAVYAADSYFRYTQTNPSWNVVGICGTSGVGEGALLHYETWLDQAASPNCAETVLSSCDLPGHVTEFVVADFNHCALGTYYPQVLWGGGDYVIYWDGDDEQLMPGGVPLSVPSDSSIPVRMWDVELLAGQEYKFYFHPEGRSVYMALFQGDTGSPWWGSRGGWVWSSSTTTFWTPSVSDVYGLAAYTLGPGGSDAFDIQVTYACTYDDLTNGTVTSISGRDAFLRYDAAQYLWGVTSVRSQPGDGDTRICAYKTWTDGYVPACVDTLIACSDTPGDGVDFVVADYSHFGTGDRYAHVEWQERTLGEFHAQWNQDSAVIEPWWAEQRTVNQNYIAEVRTLLLQGGQEYVFYLETWGTEIRMALFDGDQIGHAGGRSDPEWDVNATTTWVPPQAGYYGLVIYNEGGGEGEYWFAVGPPCDYTEMVEGSIYTSVENESYRFTPGVQAWNVAAVKNAGSVGNPDIWYGADWHSDATGLFCLQGLSVWSVLPDPSVDFIVGDYHQNPMVPQYIDVTWEETPDEYGRVTWRETSGELVVGADVIERSVDEYYIVETWDVYLEAGTEYLFEFAPRGTELHMALFGDGGRECWAPRSEAVWDAIGDVVWTAGETGWYGLVVYSEGGGNGGFTLGAYDTPVESSFFAALAEPATVVLRWMVPGGDGTEGVNLYRSLSREGPYARLNEEPLPVYFPDGYVDADLWPDTEYWYELRALSHDGSEASVEGSPVSVRTGGASVAALLGVGPNPMVGETTIYYHVPEPGAEVELRLVNIKGELVTTLVDDPSHPAGTHALAWDGRSDDGRPVVSGVYFYELTIGTWQRAGKLAIVR